MKPPRVYARGKYFWYQIHNSLTKGPDRKPITFESGVTVPLDITPPKKIKEDPDWWKKSKHKKYIEGFIDDVQHLRNKISRGELTEPAILKRKQRVSLQDLLDLYNQESNEVTNDTIRHRKVAVAKFLTYCPGATTVNIDNKITKGFKKWALKNTTSPIAPSSLRGYIVELRSLFKYAIQEGYATANPFTGIKVKVIKKPPQRSEMEDERKLFIFLYHADRDLFYEVLFQRLTGYRIKDVLGFLRSFIALEKRDILYYNNKKQRWEEYPIDDPLYWLLSQIPDYGHMFLLYFRTYRDVNTYLKAACSFAGVPVITTHKLKKNYGTEIYRQNPDPITLSRLLHHEPDRSVELAANHYVAWERESMLNCLVKAQAEWMSIIKEIENSAAPTGAGVFKSVTREQRKQGKVKIQNGDIYKKSPKANP